jgi:hypothetical protein
MTNLQQKVLLTVLDKGLLALIVAVAGYWFSRSLESFKTKIQSENSRRLLASERLATLRKRFDNDMDLVGIVEVLQREQRGDDVGAASGYRMRKLPAFLEEEIAHLLRFGVIAIGEADDAFGDEVSLCDGSKLLWQDETEPRSDVFWGSFNRLARAIHDHRQLRH